MAKQHYLRFLIRDESDDLIFPVRETESDRLSSILESIDGYKARLNFFWFDTVDGQSVIVNLGDVQAVRCLWEFANGPADLLRNEEPVLIKLRGLNEPIEDIPEEGEGLYDLFTNLEMSVDASAFHSFIDMDGEPLILSAKEVVWIIAPTHILEDGRKTIARKDGLDD
jgi:hypothetical protein